QPEINKEGQASTTKEKENSISKIPEDVYYNKVLGMLVGSAIGDAMGAPTEMWNRKDIRLEYGYVNDLDTMVRFPSAEGTWKYNLPAGGTTDDTRWKKLFVNYAIEESWPELSANQFANHIIENYKADIKTLKSTEGLQPGPYEENLMKMAWLQEWAIVADAHANNNMTEYADALSKFYGGEMTCAGMLYSPVVGACAPADPLNAYQVAYDLAFFDIGYARDITALIAAMVSQAFIANGEPSAIINVVRTVDPKEYFKSRLVGRASYRFYQMANSIVSESKELSLKDKGSDFKIPRAWQPMDSLNYLQLSHAYALLDKSNEDMPFHSGEIFLITITAMMYSDYDFEKTMEFIINYGRDNDTVAAVAGAILGAYWGADHLPEKKVKQVLKVNKELLDNDLEKLAFLMKEKFVRKRK
ncbi:MAG: ADP-ribosylglycohydrolase family protein, partial [Bacteroidia bacterium]|nr:ADP-ribosylglycohydrolase family protein [Bacteroidia bacterium]